MSDPKHPDDKKGKHADPFSNIGTAGRSARPGAIGAELGDLDFEPDALLDSLMPTEEQSPAQAAPSKSEPQPAEAELEELEPAEAELEELEPAEAELEELEPAEAELEELEPAEAELEPLDAEDDDAPTVFRQPAWPAEEEGRAPAAAAEPADVDDDDAPTVFRQAPSDVDAAPLHEAADVGLGPLGAPTANAKPSVPRAAVPPRPAPSTPRGDREASPTPPAATGPAAFPASDGFTAEPPAVNPPGPPPLEPFPMAASAAAPEVAPRPAAPRDAEAEAAPDGASPGERMADATTDDDLPTRVLDADKLMEFAAAFDGEDEDAELTRLYGGDPSDGLESLPPPGVEPELEEMPASFPPPERLSLGWEQEQPAAAYLAEHELLDDWAARAEWIESEARENEQPQERARALLVASELWALTGDLERARAVAAEATGGGANLPLVGRQARWLAAAQDDWKSVASALEVEMRASPTAETRAHGAYLSAEVHRLKLDDGEGAKRRLDHAARALPDDPRAHLLRLAHQLGEGVGAPSYRWPPSGTLALLAEATDEIRRLRTGEAPPTEAGPSAGVAFEDARRALEAGNPVGAAQALETLALVPGLERGALWLAASLLASSTDTRPRAIELLSSLLEREPSSAAIRALASRALEQSDPKAIRTALENESAEAFSPTDRVALAALTAADPGGITPWLQVLLSDEALRPLGTAALSCVLAPGAPHEAGSGAEAARTEVALGRALASATEDSGPESALRSAFEQFVAKHDESPTARALALELASHEQDAQEVADQLAQWPEPEGEHDKAGHDRLLAAAMVREVAGKRDDARRDFEVAIGAYPKSEAATRALVASVGPEDAAEALTALAEATGDEAQRSLLLVEAALRLGPGQPETFDDLLARAAEAAPGLPFAYRFGEQHARQRGDAEQLLTWIRLRREASSDSLEKALDSVREALLIADTNVELAASLMQEASETRPDDIAVHELHERLSPAASTDKGKWREEVAATADETAKGPLLLAASLEYARAGDLESAARAALAAADFDDSGMAAVMAEEAAAGGAGAARLSEQLFDQARAESDPLVQRELYARLSRLDLARGETSSAILWQNAILERQPEYLPALRRLEHQYISTGRHDEMGSVAASLCGLLDTNEMLAHAVLATRFRARTGEWETARSLVQRAAQQEPASLWALRQLSAHARVAGDDAELLRADTQLCDRATQAIDAATLALRAGEAATRLGRLDEARSLLDRSVELMPDHLVALTTRAEVLEHSGDFAGAAEAREAAAAASAVDTHRLAAWHQAAILWLDRANDTERGTLALERAADLEGASDDVYERLQALYVAAGERQKLAALLEQRLERTTDPDARVALEVTRGRALAEIGDRGAAKEALAAALDANPDHADALDAFAQVCVAEGDWEDAEQAWIRLARHAGDPARQIQIYMKLGALYEKDLPNPARAELSYLEVLKRKAGDLDATRRLVHVYGQLDKPDKAIEIQTKLVKEAESPEDKRARTIELAEAYEHIAKDKRQAQTTLEKARKAWSNDGNVLRALARFYERHGDNAAQNMLLDRAAGDARRALNTGRFDPSFFDVLGAVGEIRGNQDAATVARATLAAIEGREADAAVAGAGARAGSRELDDLLAPDLMTLPLRALLQRTGGALDAAHAVDLRALRASALPDELTEYVGSVQQIAAGFGLANLEVYFSPSVGYGCLAAGVNPPRLVLGAGLLESEDDDARWFLVLRSLKVLQTGGAAMARTAPIDLWPLTAAYLSLLAPNWKAPNVDAKKLADARKRLAPVMPGNLGTDVPVLALEVAGALGNRASQLGTAVNQWGNHAALLALGDPAAGLRAIGLAAGQASGPPPEGAERKKWIMRNPEARDLAIFSVSEQYAQARAQLGVGT